GASEDAVVVTIAMPNEGTWVATDLWLYAGVSGESAASLAIGPTGGRTRVLASARIVEMPTPRGYDLEAFVPWREIPGASDWTGGRGRIQLRDVDAPGGSPSVSETAAMRGNDPSTLPYLSGIGGELGALALFLRDRSLARTDVAQDLRGDVAGDTTLERVVI